MNSWWALMKQQPVWVSSFETGELECKNLDYIK